MSSDFCFGIHLPSIPKLDVQMKCALCCVQELEGMTMPKRASCLIIGRHPEAPKEVRVICKQLTGLLQLGNCGACLCIKVPGSKVMTPPEFEATAGCSKGKNWKVR